MAIKVVTDSTSDLPEKYAKQYEIGVVPLNVHFGDEVCKDGVDIWSDEFYLRMGNEPVLPNTSQPAPGEFIKIYRSIAQPGDTIISLHLSAEFSGTVGSAKVAAGMVEDEGLRVVVVDSRTATMGLGWMAVEAARLAQRGATEAEILAKLDTMRQEGVVHFTVTNLEYLHRTGRIGKAGVLMGSLLNIKPLLTIRDGMIVPLEKVRGNYQKVAEKVVDDLLGRFGGAPLLLSVIQGEDDDVASVLAQEAQARLTIAELIPTVAGPVVGSHTGPKVAGIAAVPKR